MVTELDEKDLVKDGAPSRPVSREVQAQAKNYFKSVPVGTDASYRSKGVLREPTRRADGRPDYGGSGQLSKFIPSDYKAQLAAVRSHKDDIREMRGLKPKYREAATTKKSFSEAQARGLTRSVMAEESYSDDMDDLSDLDLFNNLLGYSGE